jgi:hypothetical protein
MGVGEPFRDLDRDPQGLVKRERALVKPVGQGGSLEQLEDEVWTGFAPTHVEDRHDIRMGESCNRLRLAQQPLLLDVEPRTEPDGLECYGSLQLAVARFVDDAESCRATG